MTGAALDGGTAAIRALATIRREMTPTLAGIVREVTHKAKIGARQMAPVRTGTLVDSIQMAFFDEGTTGVVFVAPRVDPNWSGGEHKWVSRKADKGWLRGRERERPAQFPLWLEYGTAKMYSRPFLIPTFRGAVGEFGRRAREVVRRLVEDA